VHTRIIQIQFIQSFQTMRTLKVLDLKNNPLECNDDFRGTMKFLGTREVRKWHIFFLYLRKVLKTTISITHTLKVSLGNRNNHHETDAMNSAADHEEMSLAIEWNDFARDVCKRYKENKKIDQEVLDKIDEDDYDDDEDEEVDDSDNSDEETPLDVEKLPVKPKEQEKSTKKPIPTTKAPKEKTTAKPKSTPSVPPHVIDSGNENDESQADDDYNEDDYNEDDDDEEREDEAIEETSSEKKNNLINGIKVITDVDSGIFGELSCGLNFDLFEF